MNMMKITPNLKRDFLTISSLNLKFKSSSTTSGKLLSQLLACSGRRRFQVGEKLNEIVVYFLNSRWIFCVETLYACFNLLINRSNLCYLENIIICYCKCLISNYTYMSNFHPFEVVNRGSETQLQVGKNFINEPNVLMVLISKLVSFEA